jgi:hypothetical protein
VAALTKMAPDVILANSSPVMAALKPATNTIPIVFMVVNNPVGQGFVSSFAHPGGNITGFSFIEPAIVGKWIDLLGNIMPNLCRGSDQSLIRIPRLIMTVMLARSMRCGSKTQSKSNQFTFAASRKSMLRSLN